MTKPLLLLCCILLCSGLSAQKQALYENDWVLIEFSQNGTELEIPDNEEISTIPLKFENPAENTDRHFVTEVCNYLSSAVDYNDSENTFTLLSPNPSLVVCNIWANQEFELEYFEFFSQEGAFSYVLSEDDGATILTITGPAENSTAQYRSANLSTQRTTETNPFRLYPNPARENLFIQGNLKGGTVSLFAIDGKLISDFEVKGSTLDISNLKDGMYFISINKDDQRHILKFIKK